MAERWEPGAPNLSDKPVHRKVDADAHSMASGGRRRSDSRRAMSQLRRHNQLSAWTAQPQHPRAMQALRQLQTCAGWKRVASQGYRTQFASTRHWMLWRFTLPETEGFEEFRI